MTKLFIAVACKEKPFMFDKSRMIAVPEKSAQQIADMLTKQGYKLKDRELEIWHVFNNDYYYNDYIGMEIKRYSVNRNVKVYKYYG